MKKVIIKRFELKDVLNNDKKLFNTNNHYLDNNNPQPPDYKTVLNQVQTFRWIDLFHKDNYKTIILDKNDLYWMRQAYKICHSTGKFSNLFDDELKLTCQKYSDKIPIGQYFIRTEHASLKYGMYGCGPYCEFDKIIKSMVTTTFGHQCFSEDDLNCKIYFMEFKEIDYDKEFRIFVFDNNITTISIQNLYKINEWLNSMDDNQINILVNNILNYFENNIKNKLSFLNNYVMDLALLKDNTFYFIEPNPFGKNYSSGSSLFHWINDDEKLHNNEHIEFRYTSK